MCVRQEEPHPDGFHIETHKNGGRSAAGMYRNGKRIGAWSKWHQNGSLSHQGSYLHGKAHGPWTSWGPDGEVRSAGEYLYGTKEGEWAETGENGDRISVAYRDGKKYGVERVWQSDGVRMKSETTWYADQKEGPARTWHRNGQLGSRGAYTKDKPVGLWEYWNSDGTLDEEIR